MPTPVPSPVAALRTAQFRTLTAGWALTNFADSVLVLILAVWVTDLTGSAALGGATFAALGVPALAAPFLGRLADRVSRRRMLVWTYAAGALVLVPLLAVSRAEHVWVVYLVTVLYATVAYVTAACQSGLLKDLLPDAALGHANGRLAAIDQVFRIAMPVLGAAVYAWVGPAPLVVAAIVAFVASAAVFAVVRIAESPPDDEARAGFWAEATEGFRYLFSTPPLGGMTTAILWAMAAVGLVNAVAFAILEHLGLEAALLGPLTALQGVAGLAAGLVVGRLMLRFGRLRVFSLGLVGLGVGLVPLAGSWVLPAVLGMGIVGFTVTSAVVAYVTERQVLTPVRMQGRVGAASHVVLNLPGVLVTLAGAAALAVVDHRVLVAVNVAVCLVCGLVALRMRAPAPAAD
ncbi:MULTISPECIES: MFS transporter [Isoptericola]|uniref:MFS transporter n=1 Tax=Isoptericola TaxID=254250 RepID=UPI0013FD4D61|nr:MULTISPECIES: MFS transporter [Isoptericola]